MVRQAGPGEEPFWVLPGGRVEPGELVTEALVREVQEETGIRVLDPGRVAFVAQVDERRESWYAMAWTFEVAAWEGELASPTLTARARGGVGPRRPGVSAAR